MYAPIGYAGPSPFNDWFTPDTVQRQVTGLKVAAVDPYWGYGEFLYIKSNDAILKGSLVAYGSVAIALGVVTRFLGVLLPSTTLQGFPFGVAMAPIPSGSFGWLQVAGSVVWKTSATVAADANVAIAAAGVVGASATGKQLVNVRNTISATGTSTFTANTTNGTGVVVCRDGYDGAFIGMALSGTGIPASTLVAKLDPDGRTIYTGSAIGTLGDKNSTASGSITLTGTFTGYGQGVIMFPFAQGAIT
jgi:hypothetical protein